MYVFCYGTLRSGYHNHSYLNGCEYLGNYFTNNDYTLFVSGLPYMVKRKGGGGVEGELYKIDSDTLKRLDKLEGVPDFYYRDIITVYDFEVGNSVEAYVYLHPDVFNDKTLIQKRKY